MKRMKRLASLAFMLVTVAATIEQLRKPVEERDWHGQIVFVPYDFRPLTLTRVRERWWNPDDPRLLTPHVFGVGWSINLYRLWELIAGAPGDRDGA